MKSRLLDLKKLKFEIRDQMRYDDVGDYYGDTIVSYDMKDDIVNNAILIHEFIEYVLIRSAGLSSEMIDMFDNDETAEDRYPKEFALYRRFHEMANTIERQFIENLGLDWDTHERHINTVNVEIAVESLTQEMHKRIPSEEKIEASRQVVKDVMEKKENDVTEKT